MERYLHLLNFESNKIVSDMGYQISKAIQRLTSVGMEAKHLSKLSESHQLLVTLGHAVGALSGQAALDNPLNLPLPSDNGLVFCLQEDLTAVGLLLLRLEHRLQVLDLTPEEQVLLQENADLRLHSLILAEIVKHGVVHLGSEIIHRRR